MDAPVTRSKQQMIDFYVQNLDEFFPFSGEQYVAVRTAMVLLAGEVENKFRALYQDGLQREARLDHQLVELVEANDEAKAEIERLAAELQELKAKKAAAVHVNGTAPSPEPAAPAAAPAGPRKRGPYKKKGATLDEIAQQLEGSVVRDAPTVGHIDRSLITDDPNDVTLTGRLRREESHITTQHGIPVKVTRQFIEIR